MVNELAEAEFDELLKRNCRHAPDLVLLVTALRRAAMEGFDDVHERLYSADGQARSGIALGSRKICDIHPKPTKRKVGIQVLGSSVDSLNAIGHVNERKFPAEPWVDVVDIERVGLVRSLIIQQYERVTGHRPHTAAAAVSDPPRRTPCSVQELEAVTRHYFAMLAGASGSPLPPMDLRSSGEVDLLRCEISHVLASSGAPYLDQYTPSEAAGPPVELAVTTYVESVNVLASEVSGEPRAAVVVEPMIEALDSLIEPAPAPVQSGLKGTAAIGMARFGTDYARRDAENRALGRAGEEFVLEYEQLRLKAAGLPDLAGKVEWVAKTKGDGLGYDILSFRNDGSSRYIEVKTTNGSNTTHYYVTRNEVAVSSRESANFYLYRVFAFNTRRRMYILPGALDESSDLTPVTYLGRPR